MRTVLLALICLLPHERLPVAPPGKRLLGELRKPVQEFLRLLPQKEELICDSSGDHRLSI